MFGFGCRDWSSVNYAVPQKLFFLIRITCMPGRVLFDEVCGRLWGFSVYTRYSNQVGSRHLCELRSEMSSTPGTWVFCVQIFSDSTCMTCIAVRNGCTRRGTGCYLSTCCSLIERVIPYPHRFPWRYKCFVNYHELAMNFQRNGIHTQIYEVKWRCIQWHALFQIWDSMTDHLEIWFQDYFIGDFLIYTFS
jgi:hypothetical protein